MTNEQIDAKFAQSAAELHAAPKPDVEEIAADADNLAVGQVWVKVDTGKKYVVVHLDKFVPKDRKVAINGMNLATPKRDVRAQLQTKTLCVTYGTPLVVFVPVAHKSGKHWVRPQDEFLNGDFAPATPATETD